jgi:hypothetical protein
LETIKLDVDRPGGKEELENIETAGYEIFATEILQRETA